MPELDPPRTDRQHDPRQETDDDERSVYQQDRDRMLYSAAWRRLGGVTQVASVSEVHLLHNRLTHSVKVGQIGRRIAERLVRNHPEIANGTSVIPDVVETAGLAHDIGHPPFGHVAEDELDGILLDRGLRFDGNAQSFRIVTKLAARKRPRKQRPHLNGMDLSRMTLNAILKYPAMIGTTLDPVSFLERGKVTKGSVYATEEAAFVFARDGAPSGIRSVPATIMDWADDVSYAIHDVEDYVRAGLVPLHNIGIDQDAILQRVFRRLDRKRLSYSHDEFERAFELLMRETAGIRYDGSRDSEYDLNHWASERITTYEQLLLLQSDPPYLVIPTFAEYQVEILKAVTWQYVIDTPSLATAQEGQRSVIRETFQRLEQWAKDRPDSLPTRLKDGLRLLRAEEGGSDDAIIARGIADFVCGLTEPQIVEIFQRLTGVSPSPMLGGWSS